MENLRKHQSSSAVADLQSRLASLGFQIPAPELGGTFGPVTEAAVKEFQQRRGMVSDGIVGEETWRELVESSWSLGDRPLRLSDPYVRGDDVRMLQTQLNTLGFSAGKHDGIFGPVTARALRDFQHNLAIEEDGISGHETIRALERLRLVMKPGLGPRIIEREARMAGPPGLSGKKIAVDPGHGDASSAEGENGVTERELVFRLCAKLARILDDAGAQTILTRGPHESVPGVERAQLANGFEADLFVSFRLNYHALPIAEGVATYYFEGHNVASEPGEHLAHLVQAALADLGLVDCRSHGKAYALLRETQMPAVVVEPGFVSSPANMEFIRSERGSMMIARAISNAIEGYFDAE